MMLYPKTRGDWLALRHTHISSTESAALFGLSPYTTSFELAVMKKSVEVPAEYEQNDRMTWGLRLQRAIAQAIAEDYGVKVRAVNGYASLPESRLGASFDYEIVGLKQVEPPGDTRYWECDQILREMYKKDGAGILEIKNVDSLVYKNEWHETDKDVGVEAPPHIEMQVQHQLLCCERNWAAIGVLVGGNRQILLTRERDREVGYSIMKKAGKFWAGLAAGHMPPIKMPEDADVIRQLYGFAEPGKVLDFQKEGGDEIHKLAAAHAEATALKSAAEKHHKSTGAMLMMALGDAEKALFPDMSVSAGVVGPTRVEAYDRAGYRNLRVYSKKAKEPTT